MGRTRDLDTLVKQARRRREITEGKQSLPDILTEAFNTTQHKMQHALTANSQGHIKVKKAGE